MTSPRVALVHDWLTGMRGGERVLEALCELFPGADIFTLLHLRGTVSPLIEGHRIATSFVQRLPGVAERYRHYLPLFPLAIERFDLSPYDLVVSTSHCVAKGVRPPARGVHVSYCFTPMRYVWDLYDDYFGPGRAGAATRAAMAGLAPALRAWDRRTAARVHHFSAISHFIADRIRRCYGRHADVIYPPVDTDRFTTGDDREEFYLVVSALAPYKRVDLAVAAATRLGRRLLVVGTGQDAARLRTMAGPSVEFLGWRSDPEVAALYRRARALLFPGVEDFGIVPLEATASGCPVIAYAAGGALETVVGPGGDDPVTGLFFEEQTAEGLAGAMVELESGRHRFEPKALRAHAETFDRARFKARMAAYLETKVAGRC
jgi:glycosyltransferase involved in cell wall biosynthesis